MAVSHFPYGLTNVRGNSGGAFSDFPNIDQAKYNGIHQTGNTYNASNYVITGTGAVSLASAKGGLLTLTNSAISAENTFLQWRGGNATAVEPFLFETGKKMVFKARFRVDSVSNSQLVFGLQKTDTTPLAVTDGVYFIKINGTASVSFVLCKNSILSTISNVATVLDNTFIELAFYYDGGTKVEVFVNDVKVATQTTLTNLPNTTLTLSYGVQNASAVSRVLGINYIQAFGEF